MPQMSPMNWLVLMMMFSFAAYLTLVKINFFLKLNNGKKNFFGGPKKPLFNLHI